MRFDLPGAHSLSFTRYYFFVIAVISVSFLIWTAGSQESYAHPVFVDSSPRPSQSISASPTEVNVFFTEPIEMGYSKITVIGPDSSRVDRNDPHIVEGDTASIGVTLQPDLPEGPYTVTTRVLSQVDGHVVENTFTFGIGKDIIIEDGGTQQNLLSLPESASRFPGTVGQVIVVGFAFASLWLWKPLSKVPWLSSAIAGQRIAIDKGMMKLIVIGTGLVLASGVAMIIVQSISIGAGVPEAIATKFGNVWLARMMESAVLMAISLGIYRKVSKGQSHPSRGEMVAILILGLAVTVTSSLIAHAAATEQTTAIAIDFFHQVAASIWIGGLIFLAFAAVPKLYRIADERTRAAAVSILVPRFSVIIVTILGIVVITGPLLLSILEDNLALTLSSVYGRLLAVKLSLAGIMVGLGAYNQFVVQRKAIAIVARSTDGRTTSSASKLGLGTFSKSLKAEAAIGVALLFMVSLMTNSSLPSGEFPSYKEDQASELSAFAEEQVKTDFLHTAYTKEGRIELAVSPFAVGQNKFAISFFEVNGENVTDVNSVTMRITQFERGIGPITIETEKSSGNTFVADAAFSLPGIWSVEIEGQRSGANPNMLANFDVTVKPLISNLEFSIKEYEIPSESSLPLYPVYDAERQSIWVGDTFPETGRIWQFDIATKNYTMHKIGNASLITQLVIDKNGSIWYVDPPQRLLGFYNPETKDMKRFPLPVNGVISGLAMDNNGNLWMPVVQNNVVVKFEPATEKFTDYPIPTPGSRPVGISADRSGTIWFAEAIGNIARIDPATGNITEFSPASRSKILDEPTAVFADPKTSNIFVSEHEGHTISVFDTFLGIFREYPSVNDGGLPFGMAMDNYGNLWYAEHTIDRIAVIDPRTGEGREAKIPTSGSFIQWITSDDQGRIWFAEQQGGKLGSITVTAKPGVPAPGNGGADGGGAGPTDSGIMKLGFTFADVAGPLIAGGIALSALFYSKSAVDLKRNIRLVQRSQG